MVEIIFEHTITVQGKLKKALIKKNKKGNFTAPFQNSEGLLERGGKLVQDFPGAGNKLKCLDGSLKRYSMPAILQC